MRITAYILLLCTVLAGCSRDTSPEMPRPEGVTLRLMPGGYATKVIDDDNLASEQTINDLTVFLTLPGSNTITHSYIHPGFTADGEYRIVTLPLEAADLQSRDIYVVANCDETILEGITTITALKEAPTPTVSKSDNLDPLEGFCMYGTLAGFDFAAATAPPIVELERTCAKLRVNLTFPDAPGLSTENTFLIANAADHAFITPDFTGALLTTDDYFNFAAPLPLTADAGGTYTGIAYVYEASQAPQLYIYITVDGAQQEFSARLPVPQRNYLYDLNVQILTSPVRSAAAQPYTCEITVTVRDANGRPVDE